MAQNLSSDPLETGNTETSRRDFLKGATTVAASLLAPGALRAESHYSDHAKHA